MQRAVIVGGVLGLGTAAVFGAAAVASALFPNGSTVSAGWNGTVFAKGGPVMVGGPVPVPPQGGGGANFSGPSVVDDAPSVGPDATDGAGDTTIVPPDATPAAS
jgi:hypothetical protein